MKKEYILLTIILIFAFFIRISYLAEPPLWVDEAISVDIAQNTLATGIPQTSGGIDRSAYFLHYSMAISLFFFESEFGARLPSVIFGLLTILLAFFIAKEFSKPAGIITALFFATFYLEVFFSRQSRYYQLFQLTFFATLYFLYKSKEKPIYLIPAIISLFIAIDTHLQGYLLTFVAIITILLYHKHKWIALIPSIPVFQKLFSVKHITEGAIQSSTNFAMQYVEFSQNFFYLFILGIAGIIQSFFKKRLLTTILVVPSILTLIGVFSLQVFAFRYMYFLIFLLLLFSGVFISYYYEEYKVAVIVAIIILIIVPSNIFVPYTYKTTLVPTTAQLLDYTAPFADYKNMPEELKEDIRQSTLVSYFSSDVQFAIKKPDFVVPFSLDGRTPDQVSITKNNKTIDRYSGSPILDYIPNKPYYLTADFFSIMKLRQDQILFHQKLIENCIISHQGIGFRLYFCE